MALDFSRKPAGFNTVTKKREYDRLAAALLERGEQTCRYLLPGGHKENGEWRVGSLQGEKGKSMGVNLKNGVWKDFDGGDGGSDLLALWADKRGVKAHVAYDEAAEWLGWDTSKPKATPAWVQMAAPSVRAEIAHTEKPADKDEDSLWWRKVRSSKMWEYFDENGELWVTVCRKERPGEKVIRPWDHKREDWKWPEGLRPLFNLQGIKTSPDPVILVEGEKCADALTAMGYCATTMPGGASAAKVIDWTPLRGRNVIRWADNDAAGARWSEATRACLEAVGVRTVRDVVLPAGKPEGWDCADATDTEIKALITGAGQAPTVKRVIEATAYKPPAFSDIPKRRFIYDTIYQRGTVTVTAGEGGAGKSAMHVVEALAIASGRDLLGTGKPIERCRVWMIALEDDRNEMDRRIAAAMIHFEIEWPELDWWIYLSTADEARKFVLAGEGRDGVELSEVSFSALRDEIVERGIGAVQMDPYIYLSSLNENDNNAQGTLMGGLKDLAQETQVAIALVHHAKKPSGNDRGGPSAADIRGAGAIVNSARYGRTVNTMTSAEAENLDVPDEGRWAYFRTTSVKANYAPGDRSGKWFKMHGVRLPNGDGEDDGDSVGVVTKWTPPDPFKAAGVTADTLRLVQIEIERALATGNPYLLSDKAKKYPWVGECVATIANLPMGEKTERAKLGGFIKEWLKSGALITETWADPVSRSPRTIIRRGNPV